jgi:hypothetical protein
MSMNEMSKKNEAHINNELHFFGVFHLLSQAVKEQQMLYRKDEKEVKG